MKPVDDLSIFLNRNAKQIIHDAHSTIYHDSAEIPDSNFLRLESDLPLGCHYFCYSHLREYEVFQRRINQQFFSIQYVQSGLFYVRSANKGFLMEPGDFIVLLPGRDNDLLFLPELGEYRGYGIIPNGSLLPFLLGIFGLTQGCALTARHPGQVEKIFRRLHQELATPKRHTPEKVSGTIYELLLLLRESVTVSSCTIPEVTLLTQLQDELKCRIGEKISMVSLAKKYNMSLPVMNKIFQEAIHKTPYQYLIQIRMEKALQLLTENLRIKEIATRVGYTDPLHFSAAFRKIYRCSPREFRARINSIPKYN